uniref:F-box domain-containing protein n=1 Tax=Strongyloides papillosus TaxID=174720 RepID=A0A0N5B8N8_STREA
MARKRQSQALSKIPCKKIKMMDEKKLITGKKVEIGKKTSVPLTAAEKVGRNMDLMSLIVKNIDNVNDRNGIAESCKDLNILCNSKRSYVKSYRHEMKRNYKVDFHRDGPLFILFGEMLAINISRYCRSNTRKLEMSINEIIKNRHKIKILKIKNLPSEYFKFFKGLDWFENIKTVYFDMLESNYNPLGIFSEMKSLKPETLIFGKASKFWFTYKNFDGIIYCNEDFTFPKSIKNVHLVSETENINWIENALRIFNHYELDSLVLGENFTRFLTADSMNRVASIARYFKKIQFSIICSVDVSLNEYFKQTFGSLALLESCNMISDIHFDVQKCDVDVWARSDPPTEEENNTLICNLYENVSLYERYLHMKNVKIVFSDFCYDYYAMEDTEIMSILQGLSKMRNLRTFEIDCMLMPESFNFSNLFDVFNGNLKNIKLCSCSTHLKANDLKTLSKYCPNIENICLEDVEECEITIKLITSLFKNLKGLKLDYLHYFSCVNVINDLIKKDKINENHRLDWPNLNFLSVYFDIPTEVEKGILDAMDKNTPRKPGQFLLKRDVFHRDSYAWQIIIQKDTSYDSIFYDIFDGYYIF